jgi:hypothetical protein
MGATINALFFVKKSCNAFWTKAIIEFRLVEKKV